jgi:transcriptional regulator with XRE-family HTH domain
VGRHRLRYHWLYNSGRVVKSTSYEEGARLLRARTSRGLTQGGLLERVERPRGGTYSRGLLSRIEKGYANSPLYVYMHIAAALELDPGRLMGSDETQKPISEAEMTMVRFLRLAGIKPDEAIARLASAGT